MKKQRNKFNHWLAPLATLLMIAGCGGDGDGGGAAPQPVVSGPPVNVGFESPTGVTKVTIDGQSYDVADRQVLAVLADDITQKDYDAVLAAMSTPTVAAIGTRKELRMIQAVSAAAGGEGALIAALQAMPGVVYAGYNFVVETTRANPHRAYDPAAYAPLLMREKAKAISPLGRYWVNQIDLPGAQAVEAELGITRSGRIAIVDTGLKAAQNVLAEARVSRVDSNGAAISDDSTSDVKTHGLDVTAFAAGSSLDAAGVSRNADVLMVDVYRDECGGILSVLGCPLGIGRTFHNELAQGIATAVATDARVINVSWGDTSECGDAKAKRIAARQGFRAIHQAAVNLARRNDKLLTFSAGNNCEKEDDQLFAVADDPSADSWTSHALIVGASTEDLKDASFSRMGKVVNLMAPGAAVSWGGSATNGTSFSAPIVAGSASLLMGVNAELSAPEIRFLLMDSAEATIGFSDAKTAKYKGYVGENASGPNRLLNVGSAAKAAKLTRDASLTTVDVVSLAKAENKEVSFDVVIPDTGVKALDVVFVVDVSGSYGDDIATLKRQAASIVDALQARGIDVQFGISAFSDFPMGGYGSSGDFGFRRLTRITGDRAEVLAGINSLSLLSVAMVRSRNSRRCTRWPRAGAETSTAMASMTLPRATSTRNRWAFALVRPSWCCLRPMPRFTMPTSSRPIPQLASMSRSIRSSVQASV